MRNTNGPSNFTKTNCIKVAEIFNYQKRINKHLIVRLCKRTTKNTAQNGGITKVITVY